MAENRIQPDVREENVTRDVTELCSYCHRHFDWCQSRQVQHIEPHAFGHSSDRWQPSDAAGLDGRPNGIHRRQVREALSLANLKHKAGSAA